ncbi:hypothetical protein JZ785_27635 (plasmid) [Alicyclobacillus curvatus]|nr:hypothetical protein JZ785_27635 [Alicyclobacillus curvatus]
MKVNAKELYMALMALGKSPKTVKVEEIVKVIDETTGKVRMTTDASRHAVVQVYGENGHSVNVDLDKLRMIAKKLCNSVVDVHVKSKSGLTVSYPGGYFHLCDFRTTSSVDLDITSLVLDNDN